MDIKGFTLRIDLWEGITKSKYCTVLSSVKWAGGVVMRMEEEGRTAQVGE